MANVLVTGADGLLGSNLVRELLARGHTVRVFVHPASRAPTLAGLPVDVVTGDVTREGDVGRAVAGTELVFHCAAVTDMRADPKLVWAVNLEGTRHVAEACLTHGVRRLLFTGSASSFAFGPRAAPGDETGGFPADYRGVDYMESKYAALELVRGYTGAKGLDAVILAPTFMLGAFDARPSSGELIQQFLVRKLRFASPGARNFVHVADVARGMAAAVERGRRGESYLLAGTNLSYVDFFAAVAEQAGAKRPLGAVPAPVLRAAGRAGSIYERLTGRPALLTANLARFACLETCYTPAKAVAELGMPQTPLAAAIGDAIAGLKTYGHLPPGEH